MSNSRHGGKSVRFNEGSQQSGSSRQHRREDERDSGLAADAQYQSNNLEALQEAYARLLAENQSLQAAIARRDTSLSTSHRTIKQLESHATGLATERNELQTEKRDYMNTIAQLRSENEDLRRHNMGYRTEVADLHEKLSRLSVASDKMSGASGPSGASGTSGSSSNNMTRRPSKRDNQEKERLKGRFNLGNQNDGPVASTSATQPAPPRQRRPSIVATTRPPYIEEPDSRHYNLVARPAPGHEQARVPRSSHPPSSGDYQFYPLPKEPSRR